MSSLSKTVVLPNTIRKLLNERLHSSQFVLPFLPTTSAEVLSLVNDETCDARRLSETVQRDQSLAAHVLRVSNSVAYAPQEPIVSLQQAISRLGLGVIGEIAIAVSLKGKVFQVPGYQTRIRQMWMHSAAAAAYAREVARAVRHNVEGSYTCGLLHDVGRPLVMQALIDVAKKHTDRPVPVGILEAAMDEFHEPLGARLAEHWHLPEWVVEAVGHHHDYSQAGYYIKEAMITSLADKLAHWALDESLDASDFEADANVIEDLGIYGDDLARFYDLREEVLDLADSFM